jgi:hypothetical protein
MAGCDAIGSNLTNFMTPAAISPKSGDILPIYGGCQPLFGHIAWQQAVVERVALQSPPLRRVLVRIHNVFSLSGISNIG